MKPADQQYAVIDVKHEYRAPEPHMRLDITVLPKTYHAPLLEHDDFLRYTVFSDHKARCGIEANEEFMAIPLQYVSSSPYLKSCGRCYR